MKSINFYGPHYVTSRIFLISLFFTLKTFSLYKITAYAMPAEPAIQFYVDLGEIPNEKSLLTLSLAKPRYNAEAILKTYALFVYGDIQYITNLFCKNVLKIAIA
jgi:hypothetical protein